MNSETFRIHLAADCTIDPLARFLCQGRSDLAVSVAPYDQVHSILAEGDLSDCDLLAVFTQPDRVSPEFARALRYESFSRERVLREADAFAALLAAAGRRGPAIAAFNWTLPFWALPTEMQAWRGPFDLHGLLAQMNLHLAHLAGKAANLYLLDQASVLLAVGGAAFDPKLWAMGKVVYSRCALEAFAGRIRAAADALRGRARKLIVVDLDNTLWGGVVGDDGWQNLRLGGVDPIGESFAIFQRQLKALRNRGVLLAIVSKNEEAVALEALERHPEMVLRGDDFAGWRINWNDKADNIADLAAELNLGLQSVVFLDDSPHERDRVRQTLPEVLVPDWPADPAQYPSALRQLSCFETTQFSEEDRRRTELYQQEQERTRSLATAQSREEWLRGLELVVRIGPPGEADWPRVTQLFNKTNQFNLSTRRLTEAQLRAWSTQPGHRMLVVHVQDRFGCYGLVGILGLRVDPQSREMTIADWILSCRTLGRGVEDAMLAVAGREALAAGCGRITARYVPTARNKPILRFLEGREAQRDASHVFMFDPQTLRCPNHLALVGGTAPEVSDRVGSDK